MVEGVSKNSAAPTSAVHREAPEKPVNATRPDSAGVAELRRQKEPEDKRVEPTVRSETTGPESVTVRDRRLSISLDDKAQRFVFRGLNSVTGEVERQFPSEATLKRSAFLREFVGRMVDKLA